MHNKLIRFKFNVETVNHNSFRTNSSIKQLLEVNSFIHSLPRAVRDHSMPFSAASSILLCCVLFPSTQFPQLVFCPSLHHLTIYFSIYLSILLFINSFLKLFLEILFPSILYTYPNQRNLSSLK